MQVLKWFCFIVVCLDAVAYLGRKLEKKADIAIIIGVFIGILARFYVLYGTYTCWLMK